MTPARTAAVATIVTMGSLMAAVALARATGGLQLYGPAPKKKSKPKLTTKVTFGPATIVSKDQIPSHAVQVTSARTVALKPGANYRAELLLTGIEAAASNAMVAAKLQEIGPWKNLQVTGDGASRVATGIYAGKAKTAALPAEVQSVEEIRAALAAPAAKLPAGKVPKKTIAPAAAPRPPPPAPTPPADEAPLPVKRKPTQAARDLYDYVTARIRANDRESLGTDDRRNEIVNQAQIDMGGKALSAALAKGQGGVYGPLTRARGKELLGREFPK